jgi:hypothetical protein
MLEYLNMSLLALGGQMDFLQAQELLDRCEVEGISDREIGASERGWHLDGLHVAEGYFGDTGDHITLLNDGTTFVGDDARQLKHCGIPRVGGFHRNDTAVEFSSLEMR